MSTIVGLDAGCAYIKTAQFDGKGGIIEKSVLSLAKLGKSTIGMGSGTGITYLCDGEEWSINPDRMNSEDTRFPTYPYSILNTVLSYHALIEAGFTGKDKVHLSSGLPLDHFFDGADIDDNRISDKIQQFNRRSVEIRGGGDVPKARIENVYPEALSGWLDISLDNDGNDTEQQTRPVGLVDIGGRTTDIAVVLPGFQIDPDFTSTINRGYLDVCGKLNEYLIREHDCGTIETSVLDDALRTKEIQLVRGEMTDISEHCENAIGYVSGEIMREAERKLSRASHLVGTCYFGGGVEHMREQLSRGKSTFIPDRPQFSNARGYLKAMTFFTE